MTSGEDTVVGLLKLELVFNEGLNGRLRDLKQRWPVVAIPGELLLAWTLGDFFGRDNAIAVSYMPGNQIGGTRKAYICS